MSKQRKDYSEFEQTEYDRYRSIRSNKDGLQLDYFSNNVSFDNKGGFTIDVDPFHEFFAMYDDLVEYESDCAEREHRDVHEVFLFEDNEEGDKERLEQISYNNKVIERFRSIVGEPDSEEYAITGMQSELSDDLEMQEEPLNNVFSGTDVTINLGEGILNFVYADFLTPARERLKLYNFLDHLKEEKASDGKYDGERELLLAIYSEKVENDKKVYNHLQVDVEKYDDYCRTFRLIRDIAYSSLYSAIYPPVFTDIKMNPKQEIVFYTNYLLSLQKEYLELLEFCFDQDYFPELLEDLSPGERYAAYRHMYHMSSDIERNEVFHMDGNIDKDGSRGGIPSDKYISKLYDNLFEKDDSIFKDFAERYSLSIYDVRSLFARPRYIFIDYGVNTVEEMLELELSKMIEAGIRFRRCKRCGRYFIVKGNYNTNYCNRIADGETRSCQELAAMETYKKKVADVPAMAIYQRYYKRYKARERVNQIKKDDFNKWKYKAMDKREDCINGRITPKEFEEWLEGCFPNRPKKDHPQGE